MNETKDFEKKILSHSKTGLVAAKKNRQQPSSIKMLMLLSLSEPNRSITHSRTDTSVKQMQQQKLISWVKLQKNKFCEKNVCNKVCSTFKNLIDRWEDDAEKKN